MNVSFLMSHALPLLAQATKPLTSQPVAQPTGLDKILVSPIFPLAIGLAVLFLFMNRSKKKQDGSREKMLKQLKRGDRIQTIGGILGTVLRAEETRVEVKVDESSNAKMWFARSAIYKVVEDEEKK